MYTLVVSSNPENSLVSTIFKTTKHKTIKTITCTAFRGRRKILNNVLCPKAINY